MKDQCAVCLTEIANQNYYLRHNGLLFYFCRREHSVSFAEANRVYSSNAKYGDVDKKIFSDECHFCFRKKDEECKLAYREWHLGLLYNFCSHACGTAFSKEFKKYADDNILL
jgi:YHS domain-containing protein